MTHRHAIFTCQCVNCRQFVPELSRFSCGFHRKFNALLCAHMRNVWERVIRCGSSGYVPAQLGEYVRYLNMQCNTYETSSSNITSPRWQRLIHPWAQWYVLVVCMQFSVTISTSENIMHSFSKHILGTCYTFISRHTRTIHLQIYTLNFESK